MSDFFRAGGWGMYPTTLFGVLLLGAAIGYALMPERRFVPLLVSMSVVTFGSGVLGCVMGISRTFAAIGQVPEPEQRAVSLMGISESLNDIVWAFVFIVLAMLIASVGALRLGLRSRTSVIAG